MLRREHVFLAGENDRICGCGKGECCVIEAKVGMGVGGAVAGDEVDIGVVTGSEEWERLRFAVVNELACG